MMSGSTVPGCRACLEGENLGFEISHALQPIVNVNTGEVFAHEALVRGPRGEPATDVLSRVNDDNRYYFDQTSRVSAIKLAAELALPGRLSINFMPNAVYNAATCIGATLAASRRFGFPTDRIIFEVTEGEQIADKRHLREIFAEYKRHGMCTAIDDFGAGYAGLNLLAEFQPDYLKLDIELIQRVDADPVRRAILDGVLGVCRTLHITPIAEGVERIEEMLLLASLGVSLQQGYLFARPAWRTIPALAFQASTHVLR